jgi:hypothetical protein
MRRHWWLVVAVLAVSAGAVLLLGRGDNPRDLGVAVGLIDSPPFTITLSGPLWLDRTLQDVDGAPDVALVAADESLRASIGRRGSARVALVELRVDGHVQRRITPSCTGGNCPKTIDVDFTPRLDLAKGGNRRIEVVARDASGLGGAADTGSHVSVASLAVRVVRSLPGVVEAEPARLPVGPPPGALLAPATLRAALNVVAAARRTGGLHALLGSAQTRVRAAGTLRDGRRVVGATLFLQLPVPRLDISAIVPGYVPGRSGAGPYAPRAMQIRVAKLRDLLVDIDLGRRRIIAVEPGPASVVTSTSRIDASAREGLAADVDAVVDAAAHPMRLVKASDAGPSFLAYDGDLSLDPRRRDWPVSLIFAGHANVGKVKDALRTVGFTNRGSTHYLAYRLPGQGLRFDSDRGLKTNCDKSGTDVHLRFYAPADVDHFDDPELGAVVVATAHLDHADNCGVGTPRFGFSGVAERRIAADAKRLGWRVQRDALLLGNAEPYRRDVGDPAHIWLGNGRATVIWVP